MTAVRSWGVGDVCKALEIRGLAPPVVEAFRRNRVDGKTLLEMEKGELKEELEIKALADRKAAWAVVQSIQEMGSPGRAPTPPSGGSPVKRAGNSPTHSAGGTSPREVARSPSGGGARAAAALHGRNISPRFAELQAEREAWEDLTRDIESAKSQVHVMQIKSPIEPSTRSSHTNPAVQNHIVVPTSDVMSKGMPGFLEGSSVREPTALGDAMRSYNSKTNCLGDKVDYQSILAEQARESSKNDRAYNDHVAFVKAVGLKK